MYIFRTGPGTPTLLCVAGLLLCTNLAVAQPPNLIPQPRKLKTAGPPFQILSGTRIILRSNRTSDDRFAAADLQQELKLVTGRAIPIVSVTTQDFFGDIVVGRLDDAVIQRLVLNRNLKSGEIGREGYVLDVEPHEVLVAGKDAAGLFYGIQTLKQLIAPDDRGAAIPGIRIADWPALRYRGTQVDLSRGPVPKLDYLKRIVRTISEFKMNQLNLYMEDAFPLEGQPLVGVLDDTLSREDFKELVSYARPYHVEIVPATEGCGHLHKLLRFEQYSSMAERPHGYDLAASAHDATAFLSNFYSQLHSVFTSPLYNIGCDETHELGTGRSAALVQKNGYGPIYVDNLMRAYDLVHGYNKQAIFWGDMAVAHPELIPSLPKDIIVATWEYFPHPSYAKWIKPFSDAGFRIIICPWVGNTSLIVPDYEVAAYNIANFIEEGKRSGAIGVNVTVWNDDGESLFAPNWWSITYGAANAWEPTKTDVAEFDRKFTWAFFRSSSYRFTEVLKKLSHINELLGKQGIQYIYSAEFGGSNDRLFWRDPFSPEGRNDVGKVLPAANEIRVIAEDIFSSLVNNAKCARRNRDTLKYFEFAALKLDALAMRYQYASEISERYSEILAHQSAVSSSEVDNELFQIQGINGPLFDLRDYTTRLRAMYRKLWLAENLSSWLPNVLQLYDRNSQIWQMYIARFEQIKDEHRHGKPIPPGDSLGLMSPSTRQ